MTSALRPRHVPRQRKPLSASSLDILSQIDTTLHGDDDVPYKTLRAQLDNVPSAQRGVDWAERVVKVYCHKQMKAQRCNTLISNIGKLRAAAGQAAQHAAFQDELLVLTAPNILTLHGYTLPLRNRDQAAAVLEIKQVMDLLITLGYPSFINSGTLLGAVREEGFLGHDDDADLAVIIAGTDAKEIVAGFMRLGDALNQTGVLAHAAKFSKGIPVLKIALKSGIYLDLFPAWEKDDQIFVWPHTFGELHHNDVFPLATRNIGGIPLPAPRDAAKMLALNYGTGWRSPDAHFEFPWQQARQRFRVIIRCYRRGMLARKARTLFGRLD